MKKTGLLICLFLTGIMFFMTGPSAFAAPKTMSDGQVFDAEFYANTYPDVKAAFGNDEAKLYEHYLKYGKAEGRLPYDPAILNTAAPAAAAPATPAPPATKDLFVGNIDETVEKQIAVQQGYCALPQNVKDFYNVKNVKLYVCTRDHIGSISDRKSLGYSQIRWMDDGPLTSANVFVCGSQNDFMPPVYTLYHELGHVLDYSRGANKYSDSWTGWTEMIPYSKTQVYSPAEAFCEAFAGYLARPEKLKKIAPNAYVYIENIIVNMK